MAMTATPPSELISVVSKSLDSAEKARAVAERGRADAEARVRELEQRLASEQEGRLALLTQQLEGLRLQNAELEAAQFLGRGGGEASPGTAKAKEGSAEAAELDGWLGSLNLARYTPALVGQGYDALEFLLSASDGEVAELATAAGMKLPHAQKFQREVALLKRARAPPGPEPEPEPAA